jgi:Ni,Fe-hydrogenase III large subunit
MLRLTNGEAAPLSDLPVLDGDRFGRAVQDAVAAGGRLAAYFGWPEKGDSAPLRLIAVVAGPGGLRLASTEAGRSFQSLTPELPAAHWFEREIAEQWGVIPEGHPWLKPLRYHAPYRGEPAFKTSDGPSVTGFFAMSGDERHEVAVGPVHAGVIEPGHFRFQCHGEIVYHLEISLGYQHRGIERNLAGGPGLRTLHHIETAAGDSVVAHAWAHALAREALTGADPSPRAAAVRAVALELERLANHIIDLGALAGDIGFLPTLNYCGRLRGDMLNTTTAICGNRMGRGWLRPGGARYDLDAALTAAARKTVSEFRRDAESAVQLLWDTPSVMARFQGAGPVPEDVAHALGLVGVAARASGMSLDARVGLPPPLSGRTYAGFAPALAQSGDVYARAMVRWEEVKASCDMLMDWLDGLPGDEVRSPGIRPGASRGDSIAAGVIEGWRGEVCHVAITRPDGRFAGYKVVDPSFHNWQGLAHSLRDQAISDFPLINKSFNLSYCGHDL